MRDSLYLLLLLGILILSQRRMMLSSRRAQHRGYKESCACHQSLNVGKIFFFLSIIRGGGLLLVARNFCRASLKCVIISFSFFHPPPPFFRHSLFSENIDFGSISNMTWIYCPYSGACKTLVRIQSWVVSVISLIYVKYPEFQLFCIAHKKWTQNPLTSNYTNLCSSSAVMESEFAARKITWPCKLCKKR